MRRRFIGGFGGVERLSIRFVDVGQAVESTGIDKYRPAQVLHFTAAALFRLLLPRLLPAYDKIIYLDVDLCVRGNIVNLYDADLGDCLTDGENVFLGAGLAPWNKLFRADFVKANGLAFRPARHADDIFFVSSALAGAHGIVFVPSSHYYHRVNKPESPDGAAREELAGERLAGLLSALLEVKPLLENRDGRLQARFYGASILYLLRIVLSCGTRQDCAALLDTLRKDALASLAFPSMDLDKVELGRHRRIFDLVRSGGDLSDILLARCDLLGLQNEEARLSIFNMHGQLDFQRGKIAERDKKLKDLNREIATGKDSLKKATAKAKLRGREIKALKSSLAYRIGSILTWPLRKAYDAVRRS